MKKFEIKEVQIDNYNDTNNQLNKFEGGLNIICGDNEIGKSTLMNFIKNIFIRKNNAKGYIKCSVDNTEFNLRAEKNKIKENAKFLENINGYAYNTGFIIDLDDLMFAKKADSEELLNTVTDSSGNAVNLKQAEYENYIYGKKQKFPLTQKNAETITFKKQFDTLIDLNKQIKNIQSKESEYNEICSQIEILDKEINKLSEQNDCLEILIQKNKFQKELNNIKINQKLTENKEKFEEIREDFGALNLSRQRYDEIIKKIEENNSIFNEKLKKLNKTEEIKEEDVDSFDSSYDTLKYGQNLSEELKSIEHEKSNLNESIKEISKKIEELKFETKSTEHQLENLNISNIEEYKTDRDMLQSHKKNYADLMNKARNYESVNTKTSKWYNELFLLLFSGMFFATLGTLILYWNSSMKLPLIALLLISVVGINTSFMERFARKKLAQNSSFNTELNNQAKDIIALCKKYRYELKTGENFIVKIDTYVQKMSDKISEYKIIENDLLKVRIELEREKNNLELKNEILNELDKKSEELNKKIDEFLEKNNIKILENYQETFDVIKELKQLKKEISEYQSEIDDYDKNLVNFVEKINNFITLTELENIQQLNKYEYEKFNKNLSDIRNIIDENISAERLFVEIDSKIKDCNDALEKYSNDLQSELNDINEEELAVLQNNLHLKREERGKLLQQKENLEEVSELLSLKNKKNIELNNLNEGLIKLIQKEIIYNLIKSAKEKFNESQPNLISAKHYLAQITNNKYSEINIENKTISGENTPEKDWDNLSRGTKEQLYLALRLGFASNYSKNINGDANGIPNLPLIIDDAFVNFDEKRTTSILKCLEEFSEHNQVLYFSCHSGMIKDILKKEKINYNYIEL